VSRCQRCSREHSCNLLPVPHSHSRYGGCTRTVAGTPSVLDRHCTQFLGLSSLWYAGLCSIHKRRGFTAWRRQNAANLVRCAVPRRRQPAGTAKHATPRSLHRRKRILGATCYVNVCHSCGTAADVASVRAESTASQQYEAASATVLWSCNCTAHAPTVDHIVTDVKLRERLQSH
jgi:hypothetical protein